MCGYFWGFFPFSLVFKWNKIFFTREYGDFTSLVTFFSDANISWVPRLLGFSVKNDPLTGDYFLKMSSGFDFGKTEAHAFSRSHLLPHTALMESENSHLSGHHLTVSKETEALGLAHGFSKCSAQSSSISITRELVRKANSWASPQISWTRSSRLEPDNLCFNKPCRWFWCMLKCESHRSNSCKNSDKLNKKFLIFSPSPSSTFRVIQIRQAGSTASQTVWFWKVPLAGRNVSPGVQPLNNTNIWNLYFCIFSRGEWMVEGKVITPFLFENI